MNKGSQGALPLVDNTGYIQARAFSMAKGTREKGKSSDVVFFIPETQATNTGDALEVSSEVIRAPGISNHLHPRV